MSKELVKNGEISDKSYNDYVFEQTDSEPKKGQTKIGESKQISSPEIAKIYPLTGKTVRIQ